VLLEWMWNYMPESSDFFWFLSWSPALVSMCNGLVLLGWERDVSLSNVALSRLRKLYMWSGLCHERRKLGGVSDGWQDVRSQHYGPELRLYVRKALYHERRGHGSVSDGWEDVRNQHYGPKLRR